MYSRQNSQYPVAAAPAPSSGKSDGTLPPISSTSLSSSPNMNSYPPQPNQMQQYAMPVDNLKPFIGQKDGRTYQLVVEQQPIRARMCGFGDKDRRPITPPPCIRLIVCDAATGKEVDWQQVDPGYFILTVDLWDAEGSREVNLVRHSSGAPTVSISSSTTTSYPPPPERPMYMPHQMMAVPQPVHDQYGRVLPPTYAQPGMPQGYYQAPGAPNPAYSAGYSVPNAYGAPQMAMAMATPPATTTGMFTRNLIGSLTVNAFKLEDTTHKTGFWFVLQDLSVRTEGIFRLKMNFVDIAGKNNQINTGRAPVLATCFSDQFQVYSAKKFPGVIESTPLSKVFAAQGIKIPIRKDGPKPVANQAEYDAD